MDGQMYYEGKLTMNGEDRAVASLIREQPQLAALCLLVAVAEDIPEGHPVDQRQEEGSAAGQPQRPEARLLQPRPH